MVLSGCASSPQPYTISDIPAQVRDISARPNQSYGERVKALRQLLPPTSTPLDSVSTGDLSLELKARLDIGFYDPSPAGAAMARNLADALERRGSLTPADRVEVHGLLVSARLFKEAAIYRARVPLDGMEVLPPLLGEASGRAYWTIGEDGMSPVHLGADALERRLVVVSHPLCGFSRNALVALESDEDLKRVLPGNTLFLAPQFGKVYPDIMKRWGKEHPRVAIHIVHQADGWPEISHWNTPNFYAIKHGKVIGRVEGWPAQQGNKVALMKLLSELATD
jgi:hypothetical protein